MTARLPELVRRSGYGPDEPIVVGLQRRGEPPIFHARLPEPGWSVVLFATADDTERRMGLLSLLLDEVTGAAAGTCP